MSIGLQLDLQRMLAIAESLRQEIPNVSTKAARPMIDAAGELQRIADQIIAAQQQAEKVAATLVKAVADGMLKPCDCDVCKANRSTRGSPTPGSLN